MSLRRAEIAVGLTKRFLLTDDLTRTQIVQYAGASGDFNPLHTDEVFARTVAGHPTVMAHGMLTMGMTAHAITRWVGEDRLTRYGVRFKTAVWPGDRLEARLTISAIRDEDAGPMADFDVVTVNGDNAEVLSGYGTAGLDP